MTLDSADLSAIASIVHGTPGTVWHVATTGNDSTGDGLTWATALASLGKAASVATVSDLILLATGDYSESAAVAIPCSVRGAGKLLTKVSNSVAGGVGFTFSAGSAQDIWFDAPASVSGTLVMAGVNSLRNVKVTGLWFGLIVTGTQIDAWDSEFVVTGTGHALLALWDNHSGLFATYRNCLFKTTGGTLNWAYYNGGALAFFWDCTFQADGGSTNNRAIVQAAGTTWVIRSDLLSDDTLAADIVVTGGEIYVADSSFDASKASGYELIPTPSGDTAAIATASAAAILVTPANKIATDPSNRVTTSNPANLIQPIQAGNVEPIQS